MIHALYRQYDADGSLLYVGMSKMPFQRMATHARYSRWGHRVAKVTLEWLPSQEDALAAEKQAIATEKPEFNCQFGPVKLRRGVRRTGKADNSALVQKIERRLAETGEFQSHFGMRAANDRGLLNRLKNGLEPRQATIEKIVRALSEMPQ